MLHGEVRPDDRGFLPEGDRGGQLAVRARDPRHRRHRAVRVDARPVHQERPGLRRGVQPDESSDLSGHQGDEGAHHPRQGHGARAGATRGEQARPGASAGGRHRGGPPARAALGLSVRRGERQEPHQRQRDVRRDCARDELQSRKGEEDLLLLQRPLILNQNPPSPGLFTRGPD